MADINFGKIFGTISKAEMEDFAEAFGVKYEKDCAECEGWKARGETFFPPHKSANPTHGKHCTCDRCF